MNFELTTLQEIVNAFSEEVKNKLKSNGSYASGDLEKSIKGIIKKNGKYLTISIQLNDYWQFVENGRKAGKFPPIDKIKSWIKVKHILPRPLPSGKLPTTDQLAYLIGRKISKVGTKPKPFLYNTIKDFDLVGKVYNEVLTLINKQLEEEIEL